MVLPHGISLEAVRSAAGAVGRATGCRLIALFGSAARRESAGAEDIDLAVLGSGPIDLVDVTNRLIRALGTQAVDVADLRTADPLLLMLVAREGVPLYEAEPTEFTRFVSLAARRYADTRKFRRVERERLRDFLERRTDAS